MAAAGFLGISILEIVFMFIFGFGGVPLGYPPLPEDPALLRAVPEESLAALQWFGSGPAAKESPNTAVRLIAEDENRRMVAALRDALLAAAERSEGSEAAALARTAVELGELVLGRPGVLFLSGLTIPPRPDTLQAGLVLELGSELEAFRSRLAALEAALLRELGEGAPGTLDVGGTVLRLLPLPEDGPRVAYGYAGSRFLVAAGAGTAEKILDGLAGKRAGLAGSPRFQALQPRARVERPAWRSWLDLPGLIGMLRPFMEGEGGRAFFDGLGFSSMGALLSEAGLEGQGCVARSVLGCDGAPAGLFGLLQGAPLSDGELGVIPGDATVAAAFRLDLARAFQEFLALLDALPPGFKEELLGQWIPDLERLLEVDLRKELLEPLGDAWCLWSSPAQGGLVATGLSLCVPLREPDRFAGAFGRAMGVLKKRSDERRLREDGSSRDGVWLDSFEFRGRTVWFLESVGEELPVAPAWCVDGGRLLAALFPQMIKAELARPTAPAASLATHPILRKRGESFAVAFLDLREIARLGWPLLTIGAQLLCDELQDEGIDLDVSMLPSAAAVLPHLGPQLSTLERVPEGFRQTVRGPLPAMDAGGGFLLGALVGLASWSM